MKRVTMKARATGRRALAFVEANPTASRSKASAVTGLSMPMITWARQIVRDGIPELLAAAKDGRIALYMAARISRSSPEKQRRFLATFSTDSYTITAGCGGDRLKNVSTGIHSPSVSVLSGLERASRTVMVPSETETARANNMLIDGRGDSLTGESRPSDISSTSAIRKPA